MKATPLGAARLHPSGSLTQSGATRSVLVDALVFYSSTPGRPHGLADFGPCPPTTRQWPTLQSAYGLGWSLSAVLRSPLGLNTESGEFKDSRHRGGVFNVSQFRAPQHVGRARRVRNDDPGEADRLAANRALSLHDNETARKFLV